MHCLVLLILILGIFPATAQVNPIHNNWLISGNAGLVSFFGDLSIYDDQADKKLTEESHTAFGISAGKQISPLIIISLDYLHGSMKGSRPSFEYYFENEFNEWMLYLDFNLWQLILNKPDSRFKVFGKTGAGIIGYKTTKRHLTSNLIVEENVPENNAIAGEVNTSPIISAGFGLHYALTGKWIVKSEFVGRLTRTDALDGHKGSTEVNDRYSFISLGLTYVINPRGSSYKRYSPCAAEYMHFKKNKNRKQTSFMSFY